METWTVQKLLRWAEEYLGKKGVSSSRLEGEQLLAHLLDMERLDLYLDPQRPLFSQELADFKVLIKRRIRGEPLQYITGKQGFWKHDFVVAPGVLIPRWDSEILVQVSQDAIKSWECPLVLDVGTGTGCIIISILADLQCAVGVATDINPKALKLARENSIRVKVQDRLSLVLGDLLTPFKDSSFHAIISNPPYVSEEEWDALPEEIRKQEPPRAFRGGKEGLFYVSSLISKAWKHLLPGGVLIMEIGWQQRRKVENLFRDRPYTGIKFYPDLRGRDRVVLARRQ